MKYYFYIVTLMLMVSPSAHAIDLGEVLEPLVREADPTAGQILNEYNRQRDSQRRQAERQRREEESRSHYEQEKRERERAQQAREKKRRATEEERKKQAIKANQQAEKLRLEEQKAKQKAYDQLMAQIDNTDITRLTDFMEFGRLRFLIEQRVSASGFDQEMRDNLVAKTHLRELKAVPHVIENRKKMLDGITPTLSAKEELAEFNEFLNHPDQLPYFMGLFENRDPASMIVYSMPQMKEMKTNFDEMRKTLAAKNEAFSNAKYQAKAKATRNVMRDRFEAIGVADKYRQRTLVFNLPSGGTKERVFEDWLALTLENYRNGEVAFSTSFFSNKGRLILQERATPPFTVVFTIEDDLIYPITVEKHYTTINKPSVVHEFVMQMDGYDG